MFLNMVAGAPMQWERKAKKCVLMQKLLKFETVNYTSFTTLEEITH